MGSTCLALDVGGTKLAAGVVEADGTIRSHASIPTPHVLEPEAVFEALCSVAASALASCGEQPALLGCGCGGPMSVRAATVSPLNIEAWRDFPLLSRLEQRFSLPSYLDNDAKALALAEGRWGSARTMGSYLAMVVSTGIGGGIVVDGSLLNGHDGNAGHIGHVVVEPEGRPCHCGSWGCLEAEASGTAIAERTGAPSIEATPAVRVRTGTLVGRAVASVANLLDLEGCFVAGSVALGFAEPFFRAAQAECDLRCRISHARGFTVRPSGLGSDGPLLGAAAVALSGSGA